MVSNAAYSRNSDFSLNAHIFTPGYLVRGHWNHAGQP